MATEKQGENVNNWKEKLHEIYEERRIAIIKKKANKKAALAWVREKLYPAFNKLVKELKEIGDIEFASHTATGKSLDNTLDFTFREFEFGETSLRYSIKLLISSKGIMGKISFTANHTDIITEKDVPSIIDRGEQEIIKDFLLVLETWEII